MLLHHDTHQSKERPWLSATHWIKLVSFVLGCDKLIIAVDHKPLLKIFDDRCLEDISSVRLRNLKKKTLRYLFRMVHIPGVKHKDTDAISRHPTSPSNPEALPIPDDIVTVNTTPLPFTLFGHPFLAGIRSSEPHTT